MSANIGPLSGIRVLDLCRFISGPTSAATLGDLGAEVIKIEKPILGDDTRHSGETVRGVNVYYPTENRNKKSITINYRSEEGKKLLTELIKQSDVIIENFRPGTMDKMGFGWEEIHKINPRIIMGSISGYGEGSPYADRPAFDSIMAATTGIMDLNGTESEGPKITGGIWFIDLMAGMWLDIGILAALRRRETTGEGQYVDIAMYDSCIFSLNTFIPFTEQAGYIYRNSTKNVYDCPAGRFVAKDGKYVIVLAGGDNLFNRLITLTDDPILHDPKYAHHTDRLKPGNYELMNERVQALVETKDSDEWDEILAKIGVPGGKIKDVQDVLKCPATYARNCTIKFDLEGLGPTTFPGTPLCLSDEKLEFTMPPEVGEHNNEIYGGLLGLSEEEIKHLQECGAI